MRFLLEVRRAASMSCSVPKSCPLLCSVVLSALKCKFCLIICSCPVQPFPAVMLVKSMCSFSPAMFWSQGRRHSRNPSLPRWKNHRVHLAIFRLYNSHARVEHWPHVNLHSLQFAQLSSQPSLKYEDFPESGVPFETCHPPHSCQPHLFWTYLFPVP